MNLSLPSVNGLVVSAYKAVGFVVLGVVLVGLLSFIGTNAFFYVNDSWVAPSIIAPTDERVLQIANQLAQQSVAREKLGAERGELAARLEDANRAVAQQERFQLEFRGSVRSELELRTRALRNLSRVKSRFDRERPGLDRANDDLRRLARERLEELLKAQLVTRDEYIARRQQLEQLDNARLGLEERNVALSNRTAEAHRDVDALRAIVDGPGPGLAVSRQLSYEVLRMQEEYARSQAELDRARASRDVLARSLAAIDTSLARYDQTLAQLRSSPLLRASEQRVTMAFVPYENAHSAPTGAPVYGCRLGIIWCRTVGRIVEVIDGEVSTRHPMRNRSERGRLVRLDLADQVWATERVLFAGRAPLFL